MGHRPLRRGADLNYQTDAIRSRVEDLERRWISNELPTALLYVEHTDLSRSPLNYQQSFDYGYSFITNDASVFYWNEEDHEIGPGGFFSEGEGSNPYITCAKPGTYNYALWLNLIFDESIMPDSTAVPGEFVWRPGFQNFHTWIIEDQHWSANVRDIRIEALDFAGTGPGDGEAPWLYEMFSEIDLKIVGCSDGGTYENPYYMFPTVRTLPLFQAAFEDSTNFPSLGGCAGVFVVQYLSDLTQQCGEG